MMNLSTQITPKLKMDSLIEAGMRLALVAAEKELQRARVRLASLNNPSREEYAEFIRLENNLAIISQNIAEGF